MEQSEDVASDGHWEDLALSVDQVLSLGLKWLPAITILVFVPYLVAWGLPARPHWAGVGAFLLDVLTWTVIAILVYAVSAVVHEALHILAMLVFARVPPSSLRFGMRLSEGVLYVHTARPMSASSYRGVLVLPAVVQGILPAAVGIVFGLGLLVVYGYVMIVSAIGDLAVLQLIRGLGPRVRVRDHPERVGCQVWTAGSTGAAEAGAGVR